jgi:protein-glutamine gamma-glutamyltransferase
MPSRAGFIMMPAKLSTQQLLWLLGTLGVVLATHAQNLPIWVLAASVAFGAWRYLLDKKQWPMPRLWLLIPITLLVGLGIIYTFKGMMGRDASLALLVVMASLKLLETRTLRDYMLVIILAYFMVGNLFLFNQTIATFALSVPPLLLLTATLINISLKNPQSFKFLFTLSGKLLLQAVPVMLILFVLFPRIPGPLWGIPQDAYSGMTGLNDSLQFGNISQLTKNSAIAFRVQFKGQIPAKNQLYWRGPVLWHQDANSWLMPSQNIGLIAETLDSSGAVINYTITLEPHNRLWLLLLDMPTQIPNEAKLTHDYSAVAANPVRTRIRYEATSFSSYKLGTVLNEREKTMSLQIHDNENPRTIALAQSWQGLSPADKVNSALQLFRTQPFIYTLNPPILDKDPVDDFLFNTKKGFCEHYATSFVYLMRAAGVPARIVTGYQGGELNPNGNYLIVRQSDAHAWAEVWLENRGWVRVDPTAAVSPERIEQDLSAAIAETDQLPMMARGDYPLLRKAFLNWDSVNNGWNQWVLGYDDKKQMELLNKLIGKNWSISDLVFWMMGAITVVMTITFLVLIKTHQRKLSPAQALYAQYLNKLKRANLQPYNHEGALDFGRRVALALPHQQAVILEIAECYNLLEYSQTPNPLILATLAQLIKNLHLNDD